MVRAGMPRGKTSFGSLAASGGRDTISLRQSVRHDPKRPLRSVLVISIHTSLISGSQPPHPDTWNYVLNRSIHRFSQEMYACKNSKPQGPDERFEHELWKPTVYTSLLSERASTLQTAAPDEQWLTSHTGVGDEATVCARLGILYYTILHYTTLYYTIPYYTTLLYSTLLYTTLLYSTLHYTTLHYTALHCTALHYTTLHYTALHDMYNT